MERQSPDSVPPSTPPPLPPGGHVLSLADLFNFKISGVGTVTPRAEGPPAEPDIPPAASEHADIE